MDVPKAAAAPMSASGARRRLDIENRARKGFASTILGSAAPGLTTGKTGRQGELKTVLGA